MGIRVVVELGKILIHYLIISLTLVTYPLERMLQPTLLLFRRGTDASLFPD